MSYWSRLAISLGDVRIVLYEGKRLILDPGSQPGTYFTALFVEMLTPIAAEDFLQQLGDEFGLTIVPKSS